MKRHVSPLGWIGAVMALTAMACTCGGLTLPGTGTATAPAKNTSTVPSARPTRTPKESSGEATELPVAASETEAAAAIETANALVTEVSVQMTAPEDMPVYEPNKDFFGSENFVSYATSAEFDKVLEFYKTELLNQGWEETESDQAMETKSYAYMFYGKDKRVASIMLTASDGQVMVLISIETK